MDYSLNHKHGINGYLNGQYGPLNGQKVGLRLKHRPLKWTNLDKVTLKYIKPSLQFSLRKYRKMQGLQRREDEG